MPERKIEQSFDFAAIDFSAPEIRNSLARAYRVLLAHQARRIIQE